jgi:predicted transcriptional regulator
LPDQETAIALTADIVAAHVSNNSVAVGDLASLISSVHSALTGLDASAVETDAPAAREPVVSVRSSVKPDAIICLVCGSKNKMIKRHLSTAHGITPAQYRAEFGLKVDYPMVAPNYSEQRAMLARNIGLGRKPGSEGSGAGSTSKGGAGRGRGRPKKAPSAG